MTSIGHCLGFSMGETMTNDSVNTMMIKIIIDEELVMVLILNPILSIMIEMGVNF